MNPIIRTAQRSSFVVLTAAYGAIAFAQSTAVLGEPAPTDDSLVTNAFAYDYFTVTG